MGYVLSSPSSWVWKILLICIFLGGAQWMHDHPDAQLTQDFMALWGKVRAEWSIFLTKFTDYVNHFPTYMRQMLDTTPKPSLPGKP